MENKNEDLYQRAIDYVANFYGISTDTAVRLYPDEVHAAANLFELDDNDELPTKWRNEFMNEKVNVTYTFEQVPPTVGFWIIGGSFHVPVRVKATDEQIKNTEELLGWEWKNAPRYGIKVRLDKVTWAYYTDAATGKPLLFDTRNKAESVANDMRKEGKEGSVIVVEYS